MKLTHFASQGDYLTGCWNVSNSSTFTQTPDHRQFDQQYRRLFDREKGRITNRTNGVKSVRTQ